MRPEHGGRLELKIEDSTPTTARYALSIFTPQGDGETTASLDGDAGSIELEPWRGTPPPAWLESFTRSLLRTMLRGRHESGGWPRRLTRWRTEPER